MTKMSSPYILDPTNKQCQISIFPNLFSMVLSIAFLIVSILIEWWSLQLNDSFSTDAMEIMEEIVALALVIFRDFLECF